MAKIARYVRDRANDYTRHSDGSQSFSAFAISDQIREPCKQAADLVIGIARGIAPKKSGDYAASFGIGPKQAFWFKPIEGPLQLRAVVEVVNTSDKAPAVEFGSGEPSVGESSGDPREQGGSNRAFRVLGRAAARVGDFHE
jgi:hypothetical protein